MQDIDFLPIEYRRQHERRQAQPWQIVAAVAIVGLVAAAAMSQHRRWVGVQDQLATLTPAYDGAVQMQSRLAEIQNRLSCSKASAELYTYLRHPWPRTQALSALLSPLPDAIAFQQVQILRESQTPSSPSENQPPGEKQAEEEKLKSATPAERDLAKLRRRQDRMQTLVVLAGTVAESSLLHRYIGDLEAMEIFDRVELDCINSVDDGQGGAALQFRVVLAVQPGYGQPGGPQPPEKRHLADADTKLPGPGEPQP